eukprot:662736-Alexandrium_andersonii.AAC.1
MVLHLLKYTPEPDLSLKFALTLLGELERDATRALQAESEADNIPALVTLGGPTESESAAARVDQRVGHAAED